MTQRIQMKLVISGIADVYEGPESVYPVKPCRMGDESVCPFGNALPSELFRHIKPLEECRDAVEMMCDAGADAVVILHSFSLFKVRDKQYRQGRPNRVVIRRFERFCRWLDAHREKYPPRTFTELGRLVREEGYQPRSVPPCLVNKPLRALTRKVVQGLNNLYWF